MKSFRLMAQGIAFFFIMWSYSGVYAFNGYGEIKGVHYPNQKHLYELRSRLLIEENVHFKHWLYLNLSGKIDGLLSNREKNNNELFVTLDDASLTLYFPSVEIKGGYTRVFWGKLDYLSPLDIVNPPILSELLLTNERKEAKLPVLLFMGSSYFGDTNHIDFILVPFYKKGIYDEFNEQYSPFTIVHLPLPVEEELPSKSFKNIECGVRVSSSFRTIDLSLYYYSGFQDFLSYRIVQAFPPNKIEAQTTRIHMFGADFECVTGKWGMRGEGAFFSNMGYQKEGTIDFIKGNSFTTGISFDRSYRDHYVNIGALYKKIIVDEDIEEEKDEITFVVNAERKFSYETKIVELFSLYNLRSNSLFLNGKFSVSIIENLWLDLSLGIFNGEGEDMLSKLNDSDFFLVKCRYNF